MPQRLYKEYLSIFECKQQLLPIKHDSVDYSHLLQISINLLVEWQMVDQI